MHIRLVAYRRCGRLSRYVRILLSNWASKHDYTPYRNRAVHPVVGCCWHFYIQWQELRLDICPYPKTIWQAWVYLIRSCAMLRPQTVRTRPLPAANWSSESHKMLRLWSAFQQWLLSNLGRVALANI